MNETPTKPSVLSDADLERLRRLMDKNGANISIQDPRVTQVQTWMLGLVGLGVIVALGWLATSVDSLNRNFERVSATLDYMERRISYLEQHR